MKRLPATGERSSRRPSAARAPLVVRKRAQRSAARRLVARQTVKGLTPEQRAFDPMERRRVGGGVRAAVGRVVLVGAAAIHGGSGVVGIVVGGRERDRRAPVEQTVKVEVREPPPPPPPPPVEEKQPE